jgi:hypothetical protein
MGATLRDKTRQFAADWRRTVGSGRALIECRPRLAAAEAGKKTHFAL